MSRVLPFLFLFILTSCAGHVVVNPKGCYGSGVWSDWKDKRFFEIESEHWFAFDHREVYLKDMLSEYGINCRKVTSLYMETKTGLGDVLLGLIPFFGHQTIKITGYTSLTDDETTKDLGKDL